ncbi:MAG TPA: BatD family protein, partial [Gemmatimonadales bacterium]|nr:BatD family protein [Gemmatimonadales bacterium]
MSRALALLALLQQAPGPALQVVTALDHDRVVPGDEVVLTIRAWSAVADPIQIAVPALPGFAIVARDERREDRRPGPGRLTTLTLRLRARTPGDYRLGPFLVRQGTAFVQADGVDVTVEGGSPAPSAALSPRLQRLLERAPPPRAPGEAAVTVVLSADSVVVGDQVDVVTIAWFDREIRQQLRRAPTVEAPRLEGVWSYPQPVPGGIAWSRAVHGRWYDLFVLHQVVFPLAPGRVAVGRARLQYALPLAFQFFSQEERYSLTSEPTSFRAWPVPEPGRPPEFAGAVGVGLSVVQSLAPPSGRQGEAFTLDVTLRGRGNVGLWPPPALAWPAGLRAYPEGSREQVAVEDGWLGGSKTFRFLVVPDSAGTTLLPALRYSYFDPLRRQYQVATAPPLPLVAAPAGEGRASRPFPPPLRHDRRRPLATSLRAALPDTVWAGLLLLFPAGYVLSRARWRRRRSAPAAVPADPL